MTETTEIPTLDELTTRVESLQAGAYIMYQTLQGIANLHQPTELEAEDGSKIDGCEHCSSLAEAIVVFPCPTMGVIVNDFEFTEPAEEETPAE